MRSTDRAHELMGDQWAHLFEGSGRAGDEEGWPGNGGWGVAVALFTSCNPYSGAPPRLRSGF